ncbi:MAG: histidine phosphatase family protein [Pirellulales bacterium]
MSRIVLIRPGSTDFDEQGRIKGTLDIPLNERGAGQVAQMIEQLSSLGIESLYSSPCQCAVQTAAAVAAALGIRSKTIDRLENLNHGLWHGKLVDEVRQCQPKVYRQLQEHPESVCPPEGESFSAARQRIAGALDKVRKKHSNKTIGIVLPEPIFSLARSYLESSELGDVWKAECECGGWLVIDPAAVKQLVRG